MSEEQKTPLFGTYYNSLPKEPPVTLRDAGGYTALQQGRTVTITFRNDPDGTTHPPMIGRLEWADAVGIIITQSDEQHSLVFWPWQNVWNVVIGKYEEWKP